MLQIINKHPKPTDEACALKEALEQKGVLVRLETYDGYKHVDLCIPKAKLDVEVDGIRHLTDPYQIVADLHRGYYSHIDGYNTMHIPNELIHSHLKEIAEALAEASKIREQKLKIHLS